MSLATYLPQDRLRALARGEPLPNRTTGAALFADISGFTPLTEKLTQTLGPRRGIEELTCQINLVYESLISEVERFGGSVIGFAGDAITCWFDENLEIRDWSFEIHEAPISNLQSRLAVSSAFALQTSMHQFPGLGLKVAVTSGPARRFVVGNPEIQYWDTLAGATIARLATAEHLANRGDIVVDEATYHAMADQVQVGTWLTEELERFAVLASLTSPVLPPSAPTLAREPLADELCPWINPAVFTREQAGQGVFLTELRPATALFLRFTGLDFETDEAEAHLDTFLRQMQAVIQRYDGTLIQLTIGDKGSYLYAAFGAPIAHEDDSRRAVKAAVELRTVAQEMSFLEPVQIGLTRGTMRTGAYGSASRRTYGVLGDEVNLAARLMTLATPGQILVSQRVHEATATTFIFETLPAVRVKGKTKPLSVFAVLREQIAHAVRLQEPTYTLPMVGRAVELQTITDQLERVLAGQGQLIGIVAEAGMGKSRLVAEVIRLAREKGFVGYGGACQSDGVNTPYLVWKAVWSAFFEVDPSRSLPAQIQHIERILENLAPTRLQALPLLGVLLNLDIAENAFTQNLEPKYRQSALRALLEDCLRAAAQAEPRFIVLEDLHWIDALSLTLLEELAQGLSNSRVGFVLASRPLQMDQTAARFQALANFTKIELPELTAAEAAQALNAKLAQLYPARGEELPSAWAEQLTARAQGNPFYLEELLNYLHDQGLDPFNPANLAQIELPDSLHTLILSRIDQLTEREKTTLRVASIIGRLFRAAWLTGYYPDLGELPRVKTALEQLAELDITPLDTPEPELAYLFKHIITHEVTYESLPFATRARLHEQLAHYLEHEIEGGATHESPLLEVLAFHYGHSDNMDKQREYFRKAGEAAQKNFANEAALEYYDRLLPLLQDRNEAISVYMLRGQVLELMGRPEEAANGYRAVLDLAQDNLAWQADAWYAWGNLSRLQDEHAEALEWLERAEAIYTSLDNAIGVAKARIEIANLFMKTGEYELAKEKLGESLSEARSRADEAIEAEALQCLGYLAWAKGNLHLTRAYYEEALPILQRLGDKRRTAVLISNIASTSANLGDMDTAHTLYGEALELQREIGHKYGMADTLIKQGYAAFFMGNYGTAQILVEGGLALNREIGSKSGIAFAYVILGELSFANLDYQKARMFFEESLAIARAIDNKWQIVAQLHNLGIVAYHEQEYARARACYEEGLQLCEELKQISQTAFLLLGLSWVELVENRPEAHSEARAHLIQSLRLREETGEHFLQPSNLIGLARLALLEGHPLRAAQFLGAVQSALATLKTGLLNFYHRPHAQTLAMVREQLGEDTFAAAWQEGAQWTLEEAVKRALES
ncbi:MAG: adenylate/guanylate cyclase domain-containing protein [Anaerolineales bacterium]